MAPSSRQTPQAFPDKKSDQSQGNQADNDDIEILKQIVNAVIENKPVITSNAGNTVAAAKPY